jgi:hypothetical protein
LPDEEVYFDDHTMAQVMRHAGLLGAPPEEGGIGDEQAMRILMLLARTGRRAGELLLLDFDCLLPITGIPPAEDASPDTVVAKLRFQQTKIGGAPNTIFVDSEVVAIVRAQQQWVHDHVRALLRDLDAPPPRYLFVAISRNNLGRHSYPKTTVTRHLKQLGELADIRDSQGRRPPLSNVHRFRHTRATSLINAGVPVHVVQRYLGHLSAEMTMRYAHTLREVHEREFLRFKKITADGAELDLDPRDLFALIELGRGTDRVFWRTDDWRNWRRRIWHGEERPANRRNIQTYPGVAPSGTRPRDLRSSFITLQIYAGVPLTTMAKQCGTSVPMIERHYAGVIENWDGVQVTAEDQIRAARASSGRGVDVQPTERRPGRP